MKPGAPRLTAPILVLPALLGLAACSTASAQDGVVLRLQAEVAAKVLRCFKPPKGFGPPYPPIALVLNFRPDGNLDGPPQLADPPGGGPKTAATTAAVLSAASRCARIDDAERYKKRYPVWQTLQLAIVPGGH
jgi:hypothetical protein